MKKNIVFKNFIVNAFGILFSRILGVLRDIILALYLGAGIYSDIFFVALKMPAFFRRIFAEGAFGQAFLPSFLKANNKGAFCVNVLAQFSTIVFLLCLLISFFSEFFTKIFAFGFSKETILLASPLVSINFWYLFFIFLVTFLGALLNYKQKFFITSFSASFFNLFVVIAGFFVNKEEPLKALYYFSYATVLSGVAQLIWHIFALRNAKIIQSMYFSIKLKKTKAKLASFHSTFIHGLLGSSANQLSSLLDTTIASFLITGSISYLYYSNRVFQLPLALFAIALSQVSFPKILKHLKAKEEKKALEFMQKALEYLSILLLLSTIIGIILASEIVEFLFQRGNFNQEDTKITAFLLQAYLLGLLPFGLQKLFSLWLYAKFKQKTAAIIAFKTLFISAFFSVVIIILIQKEEYKSLGIALASSISAFYLLFANLKEFGFKNLLAILRIKFWFLSVIFISIFAFLLYEFKDLLIQCLIYFYNLLKGLL
ncbi:murein biosynthesis integral membrane protein MurJ [Campylobacter insulaenigrae]|uniref:Probable lipid II flippase MurJ n=1 Tax=Campylobacter insulaenigrae NCTC 12927 TaxID=1031564 RepID=A0A0A8H102_9BACT|nr:murein biosynthesis integral membrane protein MurJ [Campylobacter insulaenigrae]AJC87577.1 lipid II flippase [Campylobacter insulaenigrae NCTC 12927]MCR6594354.1 murein biosynthesis integral membrane protein MurJ [Campylobacter insulaenigrae]VEH93693.1 virulence factor protein MviN [Campylobacter insulaenigrae]